MTVDALDEQGRAALGIAAAAGDLAAARESLANGCRVDARDAGGFTPLMLAADRGSLQLIQLLLEAGADPNAQSSSGSTPLLLALHGKHLECVKALIGHGADPHISNEIGWRPLDEALRTEDAALVEAVLDAGAGENSIDRDGRRPIHVAARTGSPELIRLLLQRGADASLLTQDSLGWDAWMFAKQMGRGPVLLELKRSGFEPKASQAAITCSAPRKSAVIGLLLRLSRWNWIRGFKVGTLLLDRGERSSAMASIAGALEMIEHSQPHAVDRLRRDLPLLWVPGVTVSRGAYLKAHSLCVLGLDHLVSADSSLKAVAGTIVHEGVHARLRRFRYAADVMTRARIERLCFQAQIAFLERVGSSRAELERAQVWARIDPTVWTDDDAIVRQTEYLQTRGWPRWLVAIAGAVARSWRPTVYSG